MPRVLVFLYLFSSVSLLAQVEKSAQIRLNPHAYAAPRGQEPLQQMLFGAQGEWLNPQTREFPWAISFHLQTEINGQRSFSWDIDRAWFGTRIFSGEWTLWGNFGRMHPTELSKNPGYQPWGLLAERQAQNLGLDLGYSTSKTGNLPEPILIGWLGPHLYLENENFGAGFSISPFFVPSQGSEVYFPDKASPHASRFARRPPSVVQIGDRTLPLEVKVDRSRIFEEVVLQPQFYSQVYARYHPRLEAWLSFSRSPSPDADFVIDESYLRVDENRLAAVGVARPQFHQRYDTTLTHSWKMPVDFANPKLLVSGFASSEATNGVEGRLQNDYLSLSFSHEWDPKEKKSRYLSQLAQIDLKTPVSFLFENLWMYAGAKTHVNYVDLWSYLGFYYKLTREAHMGLAADFFYGNENSYFGEWRTNDRIGFVFVWEVGA